MWGNGPRGSNGTCSTLCWFSVTPSATHNQIGPSWCCFPSGWVCVCSRTLWVSPTSSPVRLGVSPSAASTPTGVCSQWFEALFPCAGALGCQAVTRSTSCCLTGQLQLCPPAPQSATSLGLPAMALLLSSLPGCPSPPLLPVWMNVSSLSPWLSDFHTV